MNALSAIGAEVSAPKTAGGPCVVHDEGTRCLANRGEERVLVERAQSAWIDDLVALPFARQHRRRERPRNRRHGGDDHIPATPDRIKAAIAAREPG